MFTPEWISAISAIVMVVVTAVYVYYTTKLAKETTKLREVETSPFVTAYFHSFKRNILMEFVFENIGKAPAYNLEIVFDQKTMSAASENKLKLHQLKINYFPVGIKESYFVGTYSELANFGNITINLKYFSKDGVEFAESIMFNHDYMHGLDISMPYEVEENKRNFDNLIKTIEKLGDRINKQ